MATMETSSSDVKQIHRSIYMLARSLDERKKNATKLSNLFESDLVEERNDLIQNCVKLLFKDHEMLGKKSREILWRKGYYDYIAIFKRNWRKDEKTGVDVMYRDKLREFLVDGITLYKKIILKMESIYDLDLQYLIDFTIIKYKGDDLDDVNNKIIPINGFTPEKSLEAINYALETIHSSLLSLGDLHRYFIEFNFDLPPITRDDAARYYFEAFKLNPTIGMSQNQLGTLYYGQNHDLDSIYFYLYSLVCTVPFELSENNVSKLFLAHIDYLEDVDPEKADLNLRDFYARFYLVVDIFFFDKDVPDFNSLCHCVLIDLRKILASKKIHLKEECIFKIVSILLFCLSKLKMINSDKVYSLNAFLVAVCADLINACTSKLEDYIALKTEQNLMFHDIYSELFNQFELVVRKSREEYRMYYENNSKNSARSITADGILNRQGDSDYCNGSASGSGSRTGDGIDIDAGFGSSCGRSQKSENAVLPNEFMAKDPKVENRRVRHKQNDGTRSSDEAKESDLKSPMSSTMKNKRRNIKMRRRRKKIHQSEDESSCYDSDSSDESDLSSHVDDHDDDYDNSDISSNFESDFSEDDNDNYHDDDDDEDDEHHEEISKTREAKNTHDLNGDGTAACHTPSEEDDDQDDYEILNHSIASSAMLDKFVNLNLEGVQEDSLNFKSEDNEEIEPINETMIQSNNVTNVVDDHVFDTSNLDNQEPPVKLKYKNKYSKVDPNIIIEFLETSSTTRALKILFDWLRVNPDILFGCYHTNPEFIHKIMVLLNHFNIDLFTRKVFFDTSLINTENVREELEKLFDVRCTIPLAEDYILKNFDLLKNSQSKLDWEITIKDGITTNEENIMRIFKMVDFGFFICKMKKFNYSFCAKKRQFVENLKKKKPCEKRRKNKSGNRRDRRRNLRRRNNTIASNDGENSVDGKGKRYHDKKVVGKKITIVYNGTSNEEKDTTTVDEGKSSVSVPRKGYLRNRNRNNPTADRNHTSSGADDEKSELPLTGTKSEIMGQLWLRSEIKSLESKIKNKPLNVILTPYIVVDSKSLTEYNSIVRSLVKTKKFVVLIPNAVLCDLDELKKHSEKARNVIRWLEHEFSRGNRHLRSQRANETQTLSLIKIPRKLDRETSIFVQIAQFCNAVVQSQADDNDYASDVLTFLSGDNLHEKKLTNFSYTGILDCIPVRYDQISSFYDKYKKK